MLLHSVCVSEQGGNFYLLGVQLLGIVVIIAWTAVTSYAFLKIIDLTMGLRVSEEHERLGADVVMHGLIDTDVCAVAKSFDSRQKSNAAHHEKTVCVDAVAHCCCGCFNDDQLTTSRSSTFRRDSFLRRTFSDVTRRRESRIGTLPSCWSRRPSVDAVNESDGDARPNSSPSSGLSSGNDRRASVRSHGVPATNPDTLYI